MHSCIALAADCWEGKIWPDIWWSTASQWDVDWW